MSQNESQDSLKRKRSTNFTPEEKLRLVGLLRDKGKVIVTKVTSHDFLTSNEKESAWLEITKCHNANGNVLRSTETLKKRWQRLKTDAKTYKADAYNQVIGTGGGPSKKFDDPVLDMVISITGRGSTGVKNISDSDSGMSWNLSTIQMMPPVVPRSVLEESAPITEDIIYMKNDEVEIIGVFAGNPEKSKEEPKPQTSDNQPPKKPNLKRRQPNIEDSNERTNRNEERKKLNNKFAAARLEVEKEKLELIKLEKDNMRAKKEREDRLYDLKEDILRKIKAKLEEGEPVCANILDAI